MPRVICFYCQTPVCLKLSVLDSWHNELYREDDIVLLGDFYFVVKLSVYRSSSVLFSAISFQAGDLVHEKSLKNLICVFDHPEEKYVAPAPLIKLPL